MSKKVSFLLGSGVSIPAGMPSITEITEKVLSGTYVKRHTDGKYYPDMSYTVMEGYVEKVVAFLTRLYVEIEQYYGSRPYYNSTYKPSVNYEDLYYVALQIYDSEMGVYDNPVVRAFIDKILSDIEPLLIRQEEEIESYWRLWRIADEATHYIHDIVTAVLRKEATDVSYLSCIGDACRDGGISALNLVTLNHDTLIERFLDERGIKYVDGFGLPYNGYRYWSPEVYEAHLQKVRLFKLHGSVNWFRYEPNAASGRNDPVGMAIDGKYWLINDPNGELRWRDCGRPVLLAGTFNKMLEYTNRIFADLFCQFRLVLRETDLLIVCGYGFGDQGINRQVVEWVDSSDQNVMVLIHKQPEEFRMAARGDFKWDRWRRENKLVLVEKWIQDTSWKDIQDAIPKR
jgi:hypothetical protein